MSGTSRSGRHGEPFTIDDLANAMRGQARSSPIYVRMPDGSLAPVLSISSTHVIDGEAGPSSAGGVRAVVLQVGSTR